MMLETATGNQKCGTGLARGCGSAAHCSGKAREQLWVRKRVPYL